MNIAKVGTVPPHVNENPQPRRYDASGRRRAAAATRARILDAARGCFLRDGYAATTVATIAARAGVAPDTVYASVGPKPKLFRELIENALSGTDHPVPGPERDYVAAMRAEPDQRERLRIYADAVTAIQGRLAPLFLVLREASAADTELAALWREISARRAANMRHLVDDLATAGPLRPDLTREEAADLIWSTNSSEYYAALVHDRHWTAERFAALLHQTWCRLLLPDP
jgi:AcrR family transcriptional regulator